MSKYTYYLFSDASVNPHTDVGYGAYIFVKKSELLSVTKQNIKIKKFYDTTSTKLELQIFIYALENLPKKAKKIIAFTDSQNIISLKARREKLEHKNYASKKRKKIKNYLLYKKFYKLTDAIKCDILKIKGHKKDSKKNKFDNIFTLVDKASRFATRHEKN